MTVGGAVCEFNPFHSGHKYFLECIRKSGVDGVVCIMSGNFVQRGEIAVCDKYLRAKAAVMHGADLVIELPVPYSLATAETFARGSVGLLDGLGCTDKLFFGAESSLDDILYAIDECERADNRLKIKSLLDSGFSYPDAVAKATGYNVFDGANNVLAIEYVKQLKSRQSKITPVRIERIGAYHDETEEKDGFLSASAIRKKLKSGENCDDFLPEAVVETTEQNKLEIAILSKLRTMSTADLKKIADVNEGLEFRIREAIDSSSSLEELAEKVKTRRYTNAKIRRIILCAYLGVTKEMQNILPNFVRVLATNESGLKIIGKIKDNSDISVICNHSDAQSLGDRDKALYDFCNICDDLFALSLDKVESCAYNQRRKFEVIKKVDSNG